MNTDADESPISLAVEHSYGIRCRSFSPDSRYLVSVGDANDGFVYIWSVGAKTGSLKQYASNKCISVVQDVSWVGESTVVTVGIRHVKVWKLDFVETPPSPSKSKLRQTGFGSLTSSPVPRGLCGRNALLGELLDCTFTSVKACAEDQAIIGSDKGDICCLNTDIATPKLEIIFRMGEAVCCLMLNDSNGRILVAGRSGRVWMSTSGQLTELAVAQSWMCLDQSVGGIPVAIAPVRDSLLVIDEARMVRFWSQSEATEAKLGKSKQHVFSHSASVMGISPLQGRDEFFTFDSNGTVLYWTSDMIYCRSRHIPVQQLASGQAEVWNELKALRVSPKSDFFVSGDKYGFIR